MRVLQLIKTSDGAEWAYMQMKELVVLGVEVHAVLPGEGRRIDDYKQAGVILHDGQMSLPMHHPERWPELFASLRSTVATIEPDIIHSHFVGTTLTMRLALGRHHPIPRVFQVAGPLHLENPVTARADTLTAGDPDYWIGTCRWTYDRYLQNGAPKDRVFYCNHSENLARFPENPRRGQLRAELGIDEESPIVGMVSFVYAPKRYLGHRRGIKGHEDLIDAIALVHKTWPDVHLVVVGGPWGHADRYFESLRAYGKERLGNKVHFLGFRPNVADMYADFDVAVHPSLSENHGGAAESYLMSVPTIATDIGGFPDLVIPDQTGWLVPPHDPAHLAEAIDDALGDPEHAREMARRGHDLSRLMFDPPTNARRLLDIYETVIRTRSRDTAIALSRTIEAA